ncbi:hypothetical protein A3C37_03425 [Candidatus Peribacteria bacterium RIFCSPHIGHO2_02_FULL_53_20]|nr:MAG: hypothetical protein A3C37_03425 [Candidatus Peribacteria bacterium RIFCSPHIGHO2_02_FULL_53_20]OGJ67381.1 MAG: hypothetical protein A3B61_00405 [Candidatus Peribacteria bacterium RIFCSPLOWO2_01_FULL_53_10]
MGKRKKRNKNQCQTVQPPPAVRRCNGMLGEGADASGGGFATTSTYASCTVGVSGDAAVTGASGTCSVISGAGSVSWSAMGKGRSKENKKNTFRLGRRLVTILGLSVT